MNSELTGPELKQRMLSYIDTLKQADDSLMSDKDLFIIEHFIRGFPTSRKGKEVKD